MKTTRKDFKLFKSECEYWINKLKIDDVRVAYSITEPAMDGDASTLQDFAAKYVEIKLTPDLYPHQGETLNEMIKRLAKHEVIHILIGEMMIVAMARFTNEEEIRSCNHRIVRKLEKLIN